MPLSGRFYFCQMSFAWLKNKKTLVLALWPVWQLVMWLNDQLGRAQKQVSFHRLTCWDAQFYKDKSDFFQPGDFGFYPVWTIVFCILFYFLFTLIPISLFTFVFALPLLGIGFWKLCPITSVSWKVTPLRDSSSFDEIALFHGNENGLTDKINLQQLLRNVYELEALFVCVLIQTLHIGLSISQYIVFQVD